MDRYVVDDGRFVVVTRATNIEAICVMVASYRCCCCWQAQSSRPVVHLAPTALWYLVTRLLNVAAFERGIMSSREIDFRVIYTSADESDDKIPVDLLAGKEWTSTRYCHYPQEIVLKFHKRSNIEKIQVLCHHAFV
uniref:Centrosomal protein CEP104 N-terminal domain-containing protein n=1 Tax=Plectus sambesii TaxID=2011161 RepID=A0A914UYX9_9BILA